MEKYGCTVDTLIDKLVKNRDINLYEVLSGYVTYLNTKILNIFECPYTTKDEEVNGKGDERTLIFDVDDLFELSEIAFQAKS
jgi:hypothetical protein